MDEMKAMTKGDTRVKELRQIVKEQLRVIRFRDAEVEALRGLLGLVSPFLCRNLHHGPTDRHLEVETCPVEEKFRKAGFMAG